MLGQKILFQNHKRFFSMPIPPEYAERSLYHFTHFNNLTNILEHGALLSPNEMLLHGINCKDIAYEDIQDRRSMMEVPCGCGGFVHGYVPLYFCKRSPMLHAVIFNKIADEQLIIYLEFPIHILEQYPSVFTNASANTVPPPTFSDDTSELVNLDWDAIDTWKWGSQHDTGLIPVRQKKQAEAFIHNMLPLDSLSKIVVMDSYLKRKVEEIFNENGIPTPPITIGSFYYYFLTNYAVPVKGPNAIYNNYQRTIKNILNSIGQASSPRFANLNELLNALRDGLDCLKETSELIDLESDDEMHFDDIGTHTCSVVYELKESSEYATMNPTDKLLTEVAAYLHDIGKRPKSRWGSSDGIQRVDPNHPVRALPMLQRILTEEIATMKKRSAKVICKLVCYHDLVGDIIGKGRRVEELEKVAENERELNMLIAIAKADMKSVNPAWVDEGRINQLRDKVIQKLNEP